MSTDTKARKAEDLAIAQRILAPIKAGDTILTSVDHVARSGMTRWISAYHVQDGEVVDISWAAAKVLGYNVNNRNHSGVEMGGCGMDMGFALVYSLSSRLFPEGFACLALGEEGYRGYKCPSNDHSNRHETDHHESGGYALRHKWL